MVQLKVIYTHSKDPDMPGCRRKTTKEMEDYIGDLVADLLIAGINVKYSIVEGSPNDVTINGKSVRTILEELGDDIRIPELDDDEVKPAFTISRDPKEWNKDVIEDISDLLMKNAFSKSFADANKLDIKTI